MMTSLEGSVLVCLPVTAPKAAANAINFYIMRLCRLDRGKRNLAGRVGLT
jgi:hypothetical protein